MQGEAHWFPVLIVFLGGAIVVLSVLYYTRKK